MIHWDKNRITLNGQIGPEQIFAASQALYVLCAKQAYRDIVLDFSATDAVFGSFMVPLIAQARRYISQGHEFSIIDPQSDKLKSLFHNGNWLHLLNPRINEPSTFRGAQHLPAEVYRSATEQHQLVNRVMEVILGTLKVDRPNLKALEWCVNEITDNVLNHANCPQGGILQLSTFPLRNAVELVVADAGDGIRRTLGGQNDGEALSRAIREGVTRNKNTNQGNGLYGSFRIATISGGNFFLHSGRASLACRSVSDVRIEKQTSAMFQGTVVSSQIVCNDANLIEKAMIFRGQPYEPSLDYIEQTYETEQDNQVRICMKNESGGFGSREAGQVVRNKISNILGANPKSILEIDFSDVFIVSSSFADEAIGKLFIELGPMQFMRRIRIVRADSTVQALVDRAILQRSAS